MALDEKDLEQIAKLIAGAQDAQAEAIKKVVSEQANGAVTKALKPIREKLELVPTKEEAAAMADQRLAQIEEERKTKEASKGKSPEALELEETRKKLESMERRLQKEAADRAETDARTKRTEERSAVQAALTKAGVNPVLISNTIAGLVERGAITRDKDGAIVFARKGEYGDEQVALDDGIAGFLKTDEGLALLPPKKTGGSGDPRTSRGGAGGSERVEMTLEDAARILSNTTV